MVVAKLDYTCTAQAHVHWVYCEFALSNHHGVVWHLGWVFVDHMVPAFGFERDFEVEFAHQVFGPDASGDDSVHAGNVGLTSFYAGDVAI